MDTLVATWTAPEDGDKTITGCVVGQPIIFAHKAIAVPEDGNESGWCTLSFKSGVTNTRVSAKNKYYLGSVDNEYANETYEGAMCGAGGVANIILIPTATSVIVTIAGSDSDDIIYVYRAG